MTKQTLFLFLFSFFAISSSFAQENTIGLLYTNESVSEGYTLFSPEKSNSVYLINNCGKVLNEWTFSEFPALTSYILENGNILRAGKDSLEIRDWDNNLLWSYAMTANGLNQHHDIEPLPNGNILCIVKDVYSIEEIIDQGRDSSQIENNFVLDKIVEIEPQGSNGAEVVWEWKFIDHLIQDFDSSKVNYGVVYDHPELMDINYDSGFLTDYVHLNAIDYNENLDQVMISARHMHEIYIIDHSTTTEEAAGHSGGNSNHGGDFLWRWGNPITYRQGVETDQKLFLQHDCKWVHDGYEDENKITVFNNGGDGNFNYSSVHIITPSIVSNEYETENNVFLPLDFEWSWNGSILGDTVFESKKSGVQSLENGNILLCETSIGQISELSKEGDLLWVYKNPVGAALMDQYDDPTESENFIFRAEKYPVDYAGFIGQELNPGNLIENENSLSDSCSITLDIASEESISIKFANPVVNNTIRFNQTLSADEIRLVDLDGKVLMYLQHFNGDHITVDYKAGLYILQVKTKKEIKAVKILLL